MNIEKLVEKKDLISCDEDILLVIGNEGIDKVLYIPSQTKLAILSSSNKLLSKLNTLGIRIDPYSKKE